MSALNESILFVSFLSRDTRRRNYELDLLEEIKRKRLGKLRVVVSPETTDSFSHLADYEFPLHVPFGATNTERRWMGCWRSCWGCSHR
jgi:hypothetical protein